MKYIVLERLIGDTLQRVPILFPNFLTHSIMAYAVTVNPDLTGAQVVSAGEFSSMGLKGTKFHGKSDSMGGVPADPNDAEMIAMMDYMHGLVTDGPALLPPKVQFPELPTIKRRRAK